MGLKDFLGDDLGKEDDEYLDDDFDDNKFAGEGRVLTINDKEYHSLEEFNNNVDTQDLEDYADFIDEEIIKSERLLKLTSISKVCFRVLTYLGIGAVFVSALLPGKIGLVTKMASSAVALYSIGGKACKSIKEEKINCELDDLYDVYDSLENELIKRENEEEIKTEAKHIFEM